MTSQLNVAFICELRGSLMYLTYVFDVFSMGVCTTGHLQTSGRLVQELNICTVCSRHLTTYSLPFIARNLNDGRQVKELHR